MLGVYHHPVLGFIPCQEQPTPSIQPRGSPSGAKKDHSIGTIRHPAEEDSAAAAALRVPTKATSAAPADSSGATGRVPSRRPPRTWGPATPPIRELACHDDSASPNRTESRLRAMPPEY